MYIEHWTSFNGNNTMNWTPVLLFCSGLHGEEVRWQQQYQVCRRLMCKIVKICQIAQYFSLHILVHLSKLQDNVLNAIMVGIRPSQRDKRLNEKKPVLPTGWIKLKIWHSHFIQTLGNRNDSIDLTLASEDGWGRSQPGLSITQLFITHSFEDALKQRRHHWCASGLWR